MQEVSQNTNDKTTKSEIKSLANKLVSFEFLIRLVVWYDILGQVHIVSKIFQNKSMDIGTENSHLKIKNIE